MMSVARPHVVSNVLNRFFWTAGATAKLLVQRCQSCGHFLHPPGPVCPRCHAFDLRPEAVAGCGTVFTFTVVRRAFHPAFADDLPYIIAIVELPEQAGLRIVTRIVDCAPSVVSIGMAVTVKFEQDGDDWLPLFVPAALDRAQQSGDSL